ncbi:MAG TPA: Hsp70 family protein [Verrucomicrobiae bacterium]|nr:Hsp70 family protein [Verrucomicrobiae bacterium]
MNRTTIDFGIDLGTTNSAIAVFSGNHGETTKIIKNTTDGNDADITPSAVYINKKGDVRVGLRAKNRIVDEDENVHIEFKRQMGTDHLYSFKSSGLTRKPEELSAEILKSLRADVEQRTGEVVEASVITVPAAFELHQCDATRKAAQLAGFKESPLLQEPVAAALAYGFQVDQEKAYWLVYDFGGGTFDAAIIKSEEGTIHVAHHGGDNFLGGSNIDWAIVEKLIAPRVVNDFTLTDFSRGNQKWKRAFTKLKRAAEIAKIDLSRNERAMVEAKFEDDNGDEIEFECELTRNEVVTVTEPIILRSVDISKRVLREQKLGKDAIERVILVGGPTLAPYFREILAAKLGIQLDHKVDPLTVVASGAAVFAGTQRMTVRVGTPIAAGDYQLELAKSFKPVGLDSAPIVGGKISGASTHDFTGFTLELVNMKTQWRSGKVSLRADGVFMANLHAEKDERNTFAVELYDPSGRKQKVKPDALTYTIGIGGDVEQPLINPIGIALANNEYDQLFEKGRGLPLKATRDYRTIHPIRQGRSEDIFKVPVVEGENEKADRNRFNGALEIRGDMIRRDLPAGSEVEVTLKMDESRILTVTAYIPILDEEFPAKIEMKRHQPNPDELRKDYEAEMKRFRDVKSKAAGTGGETAERLVAEVEASPLAQEVKEIIAAAKADPTAALQGERRLLELKLKLDEATDALKWPSLVAESRDWLDYLKKVADQNGNSQQKQKAETLAAEVEEIIRERKTDRIQKRIDQITRLYYEIVMAQPGWWVYQFEKMGKQQEAMSDQERAVRLLNQGQDCLAKNNITGLQNIVRQLWDLLPDETAKEAKRGFGATIMHR